MGLERAVSVEYMLQHVRYWLDDPVSLSIAVEQQLRLQALLVRLEQVTNEFQIESLRDCYLEICQYIEGNLLLYAEKADLAQFDTYQHCGDYVQCTLQGGREFCAYMITIQSGYLYFLDTDKTISSISLEYIDAIAVVELSDKLLALSSEFHIFKGQKFIMEDGVYILEGCVGEDVILRHSGDNSICFLPLLVALPYGSDLQQKQLMEIVLSDIDYVLQMMADCEEHFFFKFCQKLRNAYKSLACSAGDLIDAYSSVSYMKYVCQSKTSLPDFYADDPTEIQSYLYSGDVPPLDYVSLALKNDIYFHGVIVEISDGYLTLQSIELETTANETQSMCVKRKVNIDEIISFELQSAARRLLSETQASYAVDEIIYCHGQVFAVINVIDDNLVCATLDSFDAEEIQYKLIDWKREKIHREYSPYIGSGMQGIVPQGRIIS